jgi:hypothetical protein
MSPTPVSGSWADVLGEGRLPRFVLICLAVWLRKSARRGWHCDREAYRCRSGFGHGRRSR